MPLWRLRSLTVCCLQAGDLESRVLEFQTEKKGLRRGSALLVRVPVQVQEKTKTSAQRAGRENAVFPLAFCPVQALSGQDDSCPPWGGPPVLFRPPSQMLMSSGNTLTDTAGNNV